MGFHKRWINKDNVIAYYNRDGIEGLKQLFSADALIVQDNIDTNKIVEFLTNDDEEGIRKLVLELAGEKEDDIDEWDEEHALDQVLNKMVEDLDEDDLDIE
tara:strand:- start:529 stop:831 length:303 start_codon:yes stop_codon:yes gene_type:complete